jgi:MFS family permease
VLIPAVIVSGIFIGVNNTITTQAVMTVSPVERPVASAAYSFVRFIGGGLAPYAAGRLVLAAGIHVPFYIASGAIVAGIAILATAHRLLGEAERVQAQQVTTTVAQQFTAPAEGQPAGALIPVPAAGTIGRGRPGTGVIVAAIDNSPVAASDRGYSTAQRAAWPRSWPGPADLDRQALHRRALLGQAVAGREFDTGRAHHGAHRLVAGRGLSCAPDLVPCGRAGPGR